MIKTSGALLPSSQSTESLLIQLSGGNGTDRQSLWTFVKKRQGSSKKEVISTFSELNGTNTCINEAKAELLAKLLSELFSKKMTVEDRRLSS